MKKQKSLTVKKTFISYWLVQSSKTLHTHFTEIVLVVIIIAAFLVVFAILELNQSSITDSLLKKQANQQLTVNHVIALAISSQLEDVETQIGDSAVDLSGVKNLSPDQTHGIMENTFQNIQHDFPDEILYLLDKNDIIIDGVNYDNLTFNDKSLAYRADIKAIHSTLKEQVSDGFYGVDGKFRIAVSYPVFDTNKNLIGIIGASTPSELYFSTLANSSNIQSQFFNILDKNQTYLSTPRNFLIGSNYFGDKVQSYFGRDNIQNKQYSTVFSGTPSSAIYNFGGERINTGYPVYVNGENQYFVFVITPTDSIYAQSNSIFFSQIIELGIVFAITLLIILFSIRKSINLMKKLEETNEHLQKEKEQSSKLASIGEKMSQMSHNMRNPLHVIMMNAELANMASKNDGNEKMIEKSEAIKKAADSMLAQIEDLMNFIRDETLKLQKKSLNEILNDAASLVKKPDTIEIQLPEKDIICKCDPHKIQVVFMNLFTNAIEAMENVGKITVRTKETGKNVIIEVENSGESISSDVMPRIFDPLFTTKKRGTGLGLPYCKNVIEQHGGTISVNPNPTVFTITLPK